MGAHWHRQHPRALAERAHTVWAQLGQRWSADGYLAVHLVLGLVASALALWGFVAMADAVVDRATITQFDLALDNNLHAHATRRALAPA